MFTVGEVLEAFDSDRAPGGAFAMGR